MITNHGFKKGFTVYFYGVGIAWFKNQSLNLIFRLIIKINGTGKFLNPWKNTISNVSKNENVSVRFVIKDLETICNTI